ncbi:MAG: glutathione S-transferase family protein [Pseudomonadota bacterium]
MAMHLTIANQLYSSWSMRPWLVLHAFDIPFTQTVIGLRRPDSAERISAVSPTGLVPVLEDGEVKVWEALAIIQYLADAFPDRAIWPRDRALKGAALSVSTEMAGGFGALRATCPMNLTKIFERPTLSEAAERDLDRISTLICHARANAPAGEGPFLFGAFCGADAMYAPICSRIDTYQLAVPAEVSEYIAAVRGHSSFKAWETEAAAETDRLSAYEEGFTVARVLIPDPS